MSQYQRMVSYLYEYKQGVKGVNVGYVRIEQRGGACRIILQMRRCNLGQLPDMAVFRQEEDGIRYFVLAPLTERNGDYRCRVDTDSADLMGSGIRISDVDGIILYQDDSYYIATTWTNQGILLGNRAPWEPGQAGDIEEPRQDTERQEDAAEGVQAVLEQSDIADQEMSGQDAVQSHTSLLQDQEDADSQADVVQQNTMSGGIRNQADLSLERSDRGGQSVADSQPRDTMSPYQKQNGMQNGRRHFGRQGSTQSMGLHREQIEQIETQAVCRNCPFRRKTIDYGRRILMTFPVMRPFPNDQNHSCVRIEPQDLGCLPMQMWSLANNHFLLQGYYCYRHLIFIETGKHGYALGVPGIYGMRERGEAERSGFPQFRAICGDRRCEGAFGYWLMPLSC